MKEALCVLIKYRLVTFEPNKSEVLARYTLQTDRVLLMIRYPKYISLIKKKFGKEAEMLMEEVLQRGYCTGSELIMHVYNRLRKDGKDVSLQIIRDNLFSLINARYFARLPYSVEEAPIPLLQINEKEQFSLPFIDIKLIQKRLTENELVELPDNEIFWYTNFDRFHQDMRDKIIVNAFTKKFDNNIGAFVSVLLEQMYIRTEPWAECSNPIPLLEIKNIIKKTNTYPTLVDFFDQYTSVLGLYLNCCYKYNFSVFIFLSEQDSCNLIRRAGDAGGGSFQIYMKELFTQLTWETIEQIILEKHDTKAARIFRLVKMKHYIELEQIQQLAMIPAKETKRLTYQLLEENFFQVQELKKTASSSGPSKCFTLFYIHVEDVVKMVLELCYKTLFNVMTRRNNDRLINKRIIDKKERVDTIALGMRLQGADEAQLADVSIILMKRLM